MWTADLDPKALTASKTRILSKQGADRFLVLAQPGAMKAKLTLDKTSGLPAAAEMKIGPLELKIERVYVNGSF